METSALMQESKLIKLLFHGNNGNNLKVKCMHFTLVNSKKKNYNFTKINYKKHKLWPLYLKNGKIAFLIMF